MILKLSKFPWAGIFIDTNPNSRRRLTTPRTYSSFSDCAFLSKLMVCSLISKRSWEFMIPKNKQYVYYFRVTNMVTNLRLTFALEPLFEEAIEERPAEVTECWRHKSMRNKAMGHIDLEPLPQILLSVFQKINKTTQLICRILELLQEVKASKASHHGR